MSRIIVRWLHNFVFGWAMLRLWRPSLISCLHHISIRRLWFFILGSFWFIIRWLQFYFSSMRRTDIVWLMWLNEFEINLVGTDVLIILRVVVWSSIRIASLSNFLLVWRRIMPPSRTRTLLVSLALLILFEYVSTFLYAAFILTLICPSCWRLFQRRGRVFFTRFAARMIS